MRSTMPEVNLQKWQNRKIQPVCKPKNCRIDDNELRLAAFNDFDKLGKEN